MPLDNSFDRADVRAWELKRAVNWQLKYAFRPHHCHLTGKRLWFTWAYRGTYMISGPGEPIVDRIWVDRTEFLVWQLTRDQHVGI